jgi:uncharacterized protein (DUF1800 family)
VIARELKQAKVLRAVMSRRQLREVLVDFWMNSLQRRCGEQPAHQVRHQSVRPIALRPNVLADFETLLLANAKSPAMGDYLDNRRNRGERHQRELRREVLELHTVSVTVPTPRATSSSSRAA